jgi:hypothetical protein
MSGLTEEQRTNMLNRFTLFVNRTRDIKQTNQQAPEQGAEKVSITSTSDNIDTLFAFLKENTTNKGIKDKLNNVLTILNPGLSTELAQMKTQTQAKI